MNIKVGDRLYTLHSWKHSSARYGPCDVCREHVSEVYAYQPFEVWRPFGSPRLTLFYGADAKTGHKECITPRDGIQVASYAAAMDTLFEASL